MNKSRLLGAVCACVITLGIFTTANASLVSVLGGQAVYDNDLDITWLADANFAKTSGFDADGKMTWANATAWAASLTVGGFTDWRLPTTADDDNACTYDLVATIPSSDAIGWNCTGGEMGHLFYNELSGTAGSSILDSGDPDLALFTNIQSTGSNDFYWSSTELFVPGPTNAWLFGFHNGFQGENSKGVGASAWAVRGDTVVGEPEPPLPGVPIPATIWLFGSGLLGLFGIAKKRKAA